MKCPYRELCRKAYGVECDRPMECVEFKDWARAMKQYPLEDGNHVVMVRERVDAAT